ncbi:MAG: hypothetical protein ACE5E5_07215 [Phycisphaerae bacterium]
MTELPRATLPKHLQDRLTAKRREWTVQALGGGVVLACLVGAGFLVGPMNRIRKEKQLVVDSSTIAGLPPDIALLGKLGTFRALAIDWASIRAERLKEQGKTYEALELHKTVCKLAPRFAKVWANAAWNMAYNISVMQYTPEARWQWVENGIKILRDEGIPYNPRSVTLYKELTWIYWNKVGGYLDDHHLDYKKALAVQMERILGPPPVVLTDKEYFDWFRKIVDAPRDLEAFIERDERIAMVASRLEGVGLRIKDDTLLEFVARNLRPELQVESLLAEPFREDRQRKARMDLLMDPDLAEPLDRLLAAVRSDVLRRRLRLDLDWMLDLMVNQYGPLDWRNGFAHSLYWSSMGERMTEGHEASNLSDVMNNARLVFFALQSMVTRGKMVLRPNFDDPFASYLGQTPDTRFIPYLFDTYLRLGKKHFGDHPQFREGTPGPNYMNGLVTNMHTWIELLYLEGGEQNLELAENLFAWLRENNPHPDGSTQERYLVTLDAFIASGIKERLLTYTAINGIVRNFIDRALKHYSVGERKAAVRALKRGRLSYNQWMKDTKIDINDRRKLQPFRILLDDQIESFIRSPRIAPLYKASLWRALPLEQRQEVNDVLRAYFEKLAKSQDPPWSVAKAFPVPPGMEQARKAGRIYRGLRRTDVEQGEQVIRN